MNGEGSLDESSGHYTEARGFMERKTASISGWFWVRSDSLPYIPFIIGQPFMEASSRLLSSSMKASKMYQDLIGDQMNQTIEGSTNQKSSTSNRAESIKSNGSESSEVHSEQTHAQNLIHSNNHQMMTLIESFNIFPPIIYSYLLIVLFLLLSYFCFQRWIRDGVNYEIFMENLAVKFPPNKRPLKMAAKLDLMKKQKRSRMMKRMAKDVQSKSWNIFTSFLLAHNDFRSETNSTRIVWFSFSLFIFFFVVAIGLNLVSVEKVATKQMPRIRSLHDLLYDEQFSHLEIIATAQFQLGNSMRSLAKRPEKELNQRESDLKILYQRIKSNGKLLDLSKDANGVVEKIPKAFNGAIGGKTVFALEEYFFRGMRIICYAEPGVVSKSTISDPFDPGTLNWMYSLDIDPNLHLMVSFNHLIMLESAAGLQVLDLILEEVRSDPIMAGIMTAKYHDAAICLDTLKMSANKPIFEKIVAAIDLNIVVSLFVTCDYIFFFSSLVLIIEIGTKCIKNH